MDLIMQVFPAFLLVLCRISAFFVVAPIFSTRSFPTMVKIGLAFFISIIVFLNIGYDTSITAQNASYIVSIIREIFAGLLIGFVAYLFFTIVQTAGAFSDMQMGFGIANIIDPITGVSAPMLGNLKFMLMIVIFLSINGHHYLLAAIMDSYKWLPLDNNLFEVYYHGDVTLFLTRTFAHTFMLALQIASPIVVTMFVTDFGLAMLARTAPQFNIFVIGIPIKILAGLSILLLLLPGFGVLFQILFDAMFDALENLFVIFKAGV
ncbi:MAG: flagellar biosynthetic protein FliR [Candidatus Cohnella colombiensis]|uniref:Flagellar biosynthetic protein FliR n=1 Tax=Candidatus Cohnella colombiensis TaxID=3121368 RepID=A0AA95EZ39_9BACL|nr:MAG: flagellar biosynthetic protein FliR [Cohnella sp.]